MSPPVLAPNIETLLEGTQLDAPDRLRAAAGWGATAVEMWGWRNKDVDALADAVQVTGVPVCAMVVDPLLSLAEPGIGPHVLSAVTETVEVAIRLGCATVVVASGARTDEPHEVQTARLVEVLGPAADAAGARGIHLALEALNSRPDHPLVLLDLLSDALDVVERVSSPWLGAAVDTYHCGRMGESIAGALAGRAHLVRHVQVAGPERDEPTERNSPWLRDVVGLLRAGYTGPVGLEFRTPVPAPAYHRAVAFLSDSLDVGVEPS